MGSKITKIIGKRKTHAKAVGTAKEAMTRVREMAMKQMTGRM